MKLNSAQIEQTLHQIDAEAIPDDHPILPELERLFGDHTYFLDGSGLNIVEPTTSELAGDNHLGLVVNVAYWIAPDKPELAPHEPEATDMVVNFGRGATH